MKMRLPIRLLSLMLAAALLLGIAAPVGAVQSGSKVTFTQVDNSMVSVSPLEGEDGEPINMTEYIDTDVVRVSIFLEGESTVMAGYELDGIARNSQAVAYRDGLKTRQDEITAAIERKLGGELDVVWNLTLAANVISANVKYGQIEAIAAVDGVRTVLIETEYAPAVVDREEENDPMMSTSTTQIGSTAAWAAGYTGAGSRLAVIDTGSDTDHQSLNAEAFLYSLQKLAEDKGMDPDAYIASLNLLDAEEIESVKDQLNAPVGSEAYVNEKLPFGYNYVDADLDIVHDNDEEGSHGSHVAGIATANRYIPQDDGGFAPALETALIQGVAPDAQLITMKVFGKSGGAYESDYLAAIEDAAILGCDSCNLSLGTANPGNASHAAKEYQTIMDNLTECGMVVAIAAGNEGAWSENVESGVGLLYAEDVSMDAVGAPGSFTNSLAVASVDNDGATGYYISVGGRMIVYNESLSEDFTNQPLTTLAGEHEYVYITGVGTRADWAALGDALEGKIALCSRGETNFTEKAQLAVDAGAIATVIYNNQSGVINMDMTDYPYTEPAVFITQADGAAILAASEPVTNDRGQVLYYTGTMTVSDVVGNGQYNSEFYTMSNFSSWGIPGSLEMKPEITAPGGSIYSINGVDKSGTAYEVNSGTSMACPQVTGMAALVGQYIRENGLAETSGLSPRQLAQSLLMSTAHPLKADASSYYSILQQGSGLANVSDAIAADSYILMGEDTNSGAADGKVKVELGDDPDRTGVYSADFTLYNLTDEDKHFDLTADFFIQAPVSDGTYMYMDTSTVTVAADAVWTVDGVVAENAGSAFAADLNGDGTVDTADGQAILDYATGLQSSLTDLAKADVDGDGDVDSYDAYLFLKDVNSTDALLPAGGSIQVHVEFTLTEDTRVLIEENYPNGTYVQGYLYAEGMANDEGVAGTVHSIPVLGFYGSWTDPSMFDVGTWTTYATGEETRTPYIGRTRGNDFKVTYADSYFDESFGGNLLVPDEVYMPERNAINSADAMSGVAFVAIRNAAASRFKVTNETTGEVVTEAYPGGVNSAYFFSALGAWYNSGMTLGTNIILEPYTSEGDVVTMEFTLAPEYYVDDEGNVDWDALGDGATFSTTMVVDNTAPELKDITISVTGNTMTVTASDNEYVAAVGLYNKTGTQKLALVGAKQDIEKGETADYTFSLEGINGKKFLLQVMDYAMNTTTYLIEMQIGDEEPIPAMISYDNAKRYWAGYDKSFEYSYQSGMPKHASADHIYYAATIVDHIVFASTDEGDLYVMPEDDFSDTTYIFNLGTILTDMAYNAADDTIYGVDEFGQLVTVDKLTGDLQVLGRIGVNTNTLACDENGTFYCNELGTSSIYAFTADTYEEPWVLVENMDAEVQSQYIQSMEIDPNTGLLYWHSFYKYWNVVNFSYLFEIDTATGEFTRYNDFWHEMTALVIPLKTENEDSWSSPTDEITGLKLNRSDLTVLKGATMALEVNVQPWTATDRSVTWTSADESIATVNSKGVITGVSEGVTTVTATSNLDPSKSVSCTVSVELLQVTLEGTLQNADGDPMFYSWNMAEADTWTAGNAIETSMTSATYSPAKENWYIMDNISSTWAMHQVDAEGKVLATAANPNAIALWDMAYSDYFTEKRGVEQVSSVYYYYLLSPKNPMDLDAVGFDLSSLSAYLTGITSLGYEAFYDEETDAWYDTEHLVLVDSDGYILNFWIYDEGEGMNAFYNYYSSDLPCEFPGDDAMENMYTSLMADESGALYLATFTGETSELYYLVYDEVARGYISTKLDDFGDNVWPATITAATANQVSDTVKTPAATGHMTAQAISAETLAAAGEQLRTAVAETGDEEAKAQLLSEDAALEPSSSTGISEDKKMVTVEVTANEAVTNGVAKVTWDAAALKLKSVAVHADYTATKRSSGNVTFGYVALEGIEADAPIATLTFETLTGENTEVTVAHLQRNNGTGKDENLDVEFEHICPSEHFADVTETDWYHEAVDYVVEQGYMTGMDDTHFGATLTMNRAQFVTVLYRMEGEPSVTNTGVFTDVPEGQFYTEAAYWALEAGITTGATASTFNPGGQLTRTELVTFMYRYAGYKGFDTAADAELDSYRDAAQVPGFSADAWSWAIGNGIITGVTADTLAPMALTNRAQAATIFQRFDNRFLD